MGDTAFAKPRLPAVLKKKQPKQKIKTRGIFDNYGGRSPVDLRDPPLPQHLLLRVVRRHGGDLSAHEVLLRGRHGQPDHVERGLPSSRPHWVGFCQTVSWQEENIHKKISVVFRILLLTVPAQYLTL